MEFINKVAVITGAARGIGRSIALTLAKEGADVVIIDVLVDEINTVVREAQLLGREALGVKCDIRTKKDVEQAAKAAIKKFQKVDILVNNAGVLNISPSEELAEDEWDRVVDTNLKGTLLCCQAFGRQMISRGKGRIVNMASVSGHVGTPQRAAYCASKAGIINLTRTLAVEWAKFGITVNSVSPGAVETYMTAQSRQGQADYTDLTSRIPLKHLANVEDVANAVAFLVSSKATHITGHDLVVDGGMFAINSMFV